jgi:hypothetical protein
MVDELIVHCLNRPAGCEFTSQRQLLAAHLKDDCPFTEEQCPDPECSTKALRKEILGDNPRCPHRLVVCDNCAIEMKASELGVSTPDPRPNIPCFIYPYRHITGCAPWRKLIALLAISNIPIPNLYLTLKTVLPQL